VLLAFVVLSLGSSKRAKRTSQKWSILCPVGLKP